MQLTKNINILLVEDAGVMRKMEKKTLTALGYNNITEAEDGNIAIDILQKRSDINLIISDWNMPNKDGYELLLWVRASAIHNEMPFLMATGRGEKKEAAKASEAGVSSFISKPFNATELDVKINEAFGINEEIKVVDKEEELKNKVINGKVKFKIAHIQITDHLVLGVLKHMIQKGEWAPKHFELETQCLSSWNPVAKALEDGTIDGACVLAPIAMDLFSYGVPIKLVMLAHKNGSIFVRNKSGESGEASVEFYKGKSFYIPHTMSIHNMLAHLFFTKIGLKPGVIGKEDVDVSFEVAPPVKMPEFINGNNNASGYLVAEPIGTKAIALGIAEQQFLSSELWENHPCCIVAFQQEIIDKYTDAVFEFTQLLVQAGKIISTKPGLASEIAVNFLDPDKSLGLKTALLKNVLTDPLGIKTEDLYPNIEDLEKIQNYMHDIMGIGNKINVKDFVDLRFAKAAYANDTTAQKKSFLHDDEKSAFNILSRNLSKTFKQSEKTLLNKEGKYLMFSLGEHLYGIEILKIIEISKLGNIRTVPKAPEFVKGIMNFRGALIPVVDLRVILNLEKVEYNEKNYIIILELNVGSKNLSFGIAVDSVTEIIDVKSKNLEEPPPFVLNSANNYLSAMVKINEEVRILLDADKILSANMRDVIAKAV
ncbi:MAG: chemotaxis protein CheW [bacterium]